MLILLHSVAAKNNVSDIGYIETSFIRDFEGKKNQIVTEGMYDERGTCSKQRKRRDK